MFRVYDVFISYRRREGGAGSSDLGSRIAQAIYTYLKSKGLQVFLDVEHMENGRFTDQLRWQVAHAPNYLFIATEAAMRFREGPEPDYVAEELRLALSEYEHNPGDRTLLPIIPRGGRVPGQADAGYPAEVRQLFLHNAPHELDADVPTAGNLREILAKVTAVNRGNLWNAGYRWLMSSRQPGGRFAHLSIDRSIMPTAGNADRADEARLPMMAHSEKSPGAPLMDAIRDTPGHLYLIGEGGIGKTTALYSVMEGAYAPANGDLERNRLNGQVPLFVELSRAPDTYGRLYEDGVSTFIQRAVYQQLRTDLKVKQVSRASLDDLQEVFNLDPETSVRPIRDLFTQATPAPEYLLLLDGLNEVSRTEIGYRLKDGDGSERAGRCSVVSMVLQEIRMLMSDCPNVRVILTSRSREECAWGDSTTLLYLSGVGDAAIGDYLRGRGLSEARIAAAMASEKLMKILGVPLFLTMYAALDGDGEPLTRGEILRLFFHQKKEMLYTAKARGEAVDADVENAASARQPDRLTADAQAFILDFILPEIAWRMARAGAHRVTRDSLEDGEEGLDEIIEGVLTDEGPTAVCGRYGCSAFREYLRNSSARSDAADVAEQLVERLGGRMRKVVAGVLDCAVMTMGILRCDQGEYSFIHQHIRDYFAAARQINALRLGLYLAGIKKQSLALRCLADWRGEPLPAEARRFIGEALGEAHNAPVCDGDGVWSGNVPQAPCDRNMLGRALDLYRGRFDGEDGYAVWNLVEILKDCRGDLSGENLADLDLTGCEVNGCALGRRGCAARLDGARLSEAFLMPRGHARTVSSVCYSPDGRFIVTASWDQTARVWDTRTLQVLGVLRGHAQGLCSVAYSPDGRHIVTSSFDRTARVWDARSFTQVGVLAGHTGSVESALYSPDGRFIVTASEDSTCRVWDAQTFRETGVLKDHTSIVEYAAYSPDGRFIITASWDNTARVWDAATLAPVGTLKCNDYVFSAVYSPDCRRIVTASQDTTAIVWDAKTFRQIGAMEGITQSVTLAVYSPDGRRIVTAAGDSIKVWDAATLHLLGELSGHRDMAKKVAFSPDGRFIVTAYMDHTARLWDASSLQEVGVLDGYQSEVKSVAYSPDQSCIVAASDTVATLWDLQKLRVSGVLVGHRGQVYSVMYSPDGRDILTASCDATARVWDARTQRVKGVLAANAGVVNDAAYSPDGRFIVTVSGDAVVRVWDAREYRMTGVLKGHEIQAFSAAYSPDGRFIVTTAWDHTARVWDAQAMETIGVLKGHELPVKSAAFSPDGRSVVTASWDNTFRVWDARTMRQLGIQDGNRDFVQSAMYSPDGRFIVTASVNNTARIWEARTLREAGVLEGHTSGVNCAIYSPDGRYIATASDDGTVRIWEVATRSCARVLRNVPGLWVAGVDLRRLHSGSRLSEEARQLLYEYGAIVDERG